MHATQVLLASASHPTPSLSPSQIRPTAIPRIKRPCVRCYAMEWWLVASSGSSVCVCAHSATQCHTVQCTGRTPFPRRSPAVAHSECGIRDQHHATPHTCHTQWICVYTPHPTHTATYPTCHTPHTHTRERYAQAATSSTLEGQMGTLLQVKEVKQRTEEQVLEEERQGVFQRIAAFIKASSRCGRRLGGESSCRVWVGAGPWLSRFSRRWRAARSQNQDPGIWEGLLGCSTFNLPLACRLWPDPCSPSNTPRTLVLHWTSGPAWASSPSCPSRPTSSRCQSTSGSTGK